MLRKYVLGVAVVTLIGLLLSVSSFLQENFIAVTNGAGTFAFNHPGIVVLIFVSLAALSAMISPFSTIPLVPIAVSLWGMPLTTGLLLLGWLIGGVCSYFVGRYGGNSILRQFFSAQRINQHMQYFINRMTFGRAFMLRMALPAEIGYGFGIIKYSFWRYLIVTVAAELVFAYVAVHVADALVVFDIQRFLMWLLVLSVVVGGFYYILRQR